MSTYFPSQNIINATNTVFSVLKKLFPGFIKLRNLKILMQTFNQDQNKKSSDSSITSTFSKLLHNVIRTMTNEEKKEFAYYAYNYGENMFMFSQMKLIKRMKEATQT